MEAQKVRRRRGKDKLFCPLCGESVKWNAEVQTVEWEGEDGISRYQLDASMTPNGHKCVDGIDVEISLCVDGNIWGVTGLARDLQFRL